MNWFYSFAMKQLSNVDAALWFTDTTNCPMSGATLLICDPSGSPSFSFFAVRDLLATRLHELPPLHYRVAGARLGLDRPWFVDDAEVDVDFHVRRIAVPAPGGRHELDELVGHLLSYPLDRARPLWELWFIEGVEHGRVALLLKLHHVIVDGVSALALVDAVFDDAAPSQRFGADAWQSHSPRIPRLGRRALAAYLNVTMLTPLRMLRLALQTLSPQRVVRGMTNKPAHLFEAPVARFNAEVSPQRRISRSRVPLDRVKAVHDAYGVTLNDVVLALISDALRRYLQAHNDLPHQPLLAQIGISTRHDDRAWGNQITSANVRLATDLVDPVQRLTTIHNESQRAKARAKTRAQRRVVGLTETIPPGLVALAVGAWAASGVGRRLPPINLIISNIRGPEYRRHVAGAVIEQQIPLGPLAVDVGLNITCNSCDGWIEFGFVTTPEIADDINELADGIAPALQALEDAAV